MGDLFQKIVEMSLMGSVVILITILARFLLRKRSKRFIMILWAVVAIRLLLPINIESGISVFNYLPRMTQTDTVTAEVQESVLPDCVDAHTVTTDAVSHYSQDGIRTVEPINNAGTEMTVVNAASAKELPDIRTVLAIVWLIGTAVITGYCSVRYIGLKRKLKDATRIGKNIYESEKVKAPFVFGLFVPRIYLPDVLDNNEREYILKHERTHIKHGDWIRKLVGMAVVAVHWFNPLVWLAYVFFERDIEMSCDESVVANMGDDVKQAYTMTLVTYARKNNTKRYLVTPLGFSKNSFSKTEVTNRVKNILNFKEGHKITAVVITAALFFVGAACSLNAEEKNEKTTEVSETIVVSSEVTENVSEYGVNHTPVSSQVGNKMPDIVSFEPEPAPGDDPDVNNSNEPEPVTDSEPEPDISDPSNESPELAETDPDSTSSSRGGFKEKPISKIVYANDSFVYERTGPDDGYTRTGCYKGGEQIVVVAVTDNGWYKTDSGNYVDAGLCSDTNLFVVDASVDFGSYVKSYVGSPYVFAGESTSGFDASGFVVYCYQSFCSVYLPHGSTLLSNCGEEIDPEDIKVGDIICFDKDGDGSMEHCGIYVGNDTYVHALTDTGVVESSYSAVKNEIGTVRRVVEISSANG